jgi:hypothetical protein
LVGLIVLQLSNLLQVNLPFQLPSDFYTAVGISSLIAGFAAVISLVITLRQNREARLLDFFSETDKAITDQLEIERDLKGLEECIVYVYNYLDIMERISFLRIKGKIPEYAARYYKSFFEYGITMMAWYTSIPEQEGSSRPYDKRSLSDNWPSLVEWLKKEQEMARKTKEKEMKAYGIEHLPPQMVKELDRCKVNRSSMFDEVEKSIGHFEVV